MTEGGPGAIVLFLYFYVSAILLNINVSSGAPLAVVAAAAFLFPLLIELISDAAIKIVALPTIVSVKNEIDEKIGDDEDFYLDYKENQDQLTKYDNQVFRYTVLLYVGVAIIITLPVVGGLHSGLSGGLLAVLGSALVFVTLVRPSYKNLKKIIKTSVKLYE